MTGIRSKNVLRGLYRQSIRSATRRSLLAALLLGSAVSAALADRSASNTGNTASDIEPKVIASGLEIPWSIVFVGDEVLVSQRDTADVISLKPGAPARSIGKVPDVTPRLDGGLLGLAVLNADGRTWIYAYHGTASDNRIVRMTYARGSLGEPKVVLAGIPGGRGHNGGRIAFGPDGMLYATTGEAQSPNLSQDPASLAGKILRMTPEGGVPSDNPSRASLVYSLGHRNPQGLTWDEFGRLWSTDFGDDAWDELNRIEAGGNYGWPTVEGKGGKPGYIEPVVQWRTQEMGPSGLAYKDGKFFVAGLTGERVWTVDVDDDGQPVLKTHFIGQHGRIRDVVPVSDGNLWFMTNKTDGRRKAPGPDDDRILSVPIGTLNLE